MRVNSCKTNLLLELARGEGDVELTVWTGNAFERVPVPPQNLETRALLAEAALRRVAHQVQVQPIGTNVLFSDSSCGAPAIVDGGLTAGGLSEDGFSALMGLYAELPALAREAGELAAETYRSIGTSLISDNVSFARGVREAHEVALRGAQLLVGAGPVAQSDSLPGSICREPELSSGGEEALRVLRAVGLPPSDVTSTTLSIDDLIYRPTGPSVMRRYLVQAGRVAEFGTLTRDAFVAQLGLTREDFAEARRVESELIRGYRRDMTAVVGRLAGESTAFDSQLYAATSRPPLPLEPRELGSLITAGARIPTTSSPTTVVDVAAVLSRWYTKVHAAQVSLNHPTIRAARESLWGQLGVGATLTISSTTTSVIVQRPELGSGTLIRSFVISDRDEYAAVVGTSAMRCATRGSRDGVPCTWSSDVPTIPYTSLTSASITYSVAGRPTGSDNWVYLLRRRPGGAIRSPGAYTVAAAWLPTSMPFTGYAIEAPDLRDRAGEFIMPSEDSCAVTDQRRRGDRTRPLCHPPADRALLSPAST